MHHPSQYGHLPHSSSPDARVLRPKHQGPSRPRSYVNPHHSKRKQDIWSHYLIGDIYERFEWLRKGTFAREKQSDGYGRAEVATFRG